MKCSKTGRIHSIESFGTLDGPGIRSVIFMQGCPLRCKYCHNPDTWEIHGGTEISVEEIIQKLKNYKPYFDASGGGVTLSGGEPLMQPCFSKEILKRCKKHGIHTAIDTSGFCDERVLKTIIPYTDLFLLDIKHLDPIKHRFITGKDNKKILKTLKFLNHYNKTIWIRHVIVPGLTDDVKHLRQMAEFLIKYPSIEQIELLPYHKMGVHKWNKLGLKYPLGNINPPDEHEINKFKGIFLSKGLKVA